MKELQQLETELTHTYNLLDIAADQIEHIVETEDYYRLGKVLSVILKSKDNLLDQLDEVSSLNIQTHKHIA